VRIGGWLVRCGLRLATPLTLEHVLAIRTDTR
jgi:hypothetical protein